VVVLGRVADREVDDDLRVEGGATWGDYHAATYAFGLASTGGLISTTGVGGLTLNGGIGYLARGIGLAIDNPGARALVNAVGDDLRLIDSELEKLRTYAAGERITARRRSLGPVSDVSFPPGRLFAPGGNGGNGAA